MNINSQQPTVTNFKGIDPKIKQGLGNLGREYRKSIADNFRILDNSDVLDLAYNNGGNIVLRIKQTLKNIAANGKDLPAGTEIKFTAGTNTYVDGSQLIINDLDITQHPIHNKLCIELGVPQFAKEAFEPLNCRGGDSYPDKLPYLGAVIDASQKVAKPLEEIKNIMANTLYK